MFLAKRNFFEAHLAVFRDDKAVDAFTAALSVGVHSSAVGDSRSCSDGAVTFLEVVADSALSTYRSGERPVVKGAEGHCLDLSALPGICPPVPVRTDAAVVDVFVGCTAGNGNVRVLETRSTPV
jgi:hypothetical protein